MKNFKQIPVENTNFIILGKSNPNANYLAFHPINDNGELMPEIPFTRTTAEAVFSVFSKFNFTPLQFSGLIDKTILKAVSKPTNTELIFVLPSRIQHLYYSENSKLKSGLYSLPNLIFKYSNKSIHVAATLDPIPNENSILFYAPFFNVYPSTQTCMGDVNFKNIKYFESFEALKDFIITAFFNSIFTHSNNSVIDEAYLQSKAKLQKWSANDLIPILSNSKNQVTLKTYSL